MAKAPVNLALSIKNRLLIIAREQQRAYEPMLA